MENDKKGKTKIVVSFIGKTIIYAGIIFVLIYMYNFIDVRAAGFIYNQF